LLIHNVNHICVCCAVCRWRWLQPSSGRRPGMRLGRPSSLRALHHATPQWNVHASGYLLWWLALPAGRLGPHVPAERCATHALLSDCCHLPVRTPPAAESVRSLHKCNTAAVRHSICMLRSTVLMPDRPVWVRCAVRKVQSPAVVRSRAVLRSGLLHACSSDHMTQMCIVFLSAVAPFGMVKVFALQFAVHIRTPPEYPPEYAP
jgi:hypothetical protein